MHDQVLPQNQHDRRPRHRPAATHDVHPVARRPGLRTAVHLALIAFRIIVYACGIAFVLLLLWLTYVLLIRWPP